jgi:hypothetical protein
LSGLAAGVDGGARSRPPAGDAERPAGDTELLARVVLALLVTACFAAFFVTQRLKHTPTDVQRFEMTPSFAPGGGGAHAQEAISFKLAHAEAVTVTIIDDKGDVVATLVRALPVARYKQLSLRWNGRMGSARGYRVSYTAHRHAILEPDNLGARAAVGEYRVEVSLLGRRRVVRSPSSFALLGAKGGPSG